MKAVSALTFIARRNDRERPCEIYTNDSLQRKLACPNLNDGYKDIIRAELELRGKSRRRRINAA